MTHEPGTCDRCKQQTLRLVVLTTAGYQNAHHLVRLCQVCTAALWRWIGEGPTNPEVLGS